MKKLKWSWFDHRTDLPKWILSGIGKIVVEWSVLERELEELIQLLTDTDIEVTRIVTSRMNARNRIFVAGYLIEARVYHDKLNPSVLAAFDKLGDKIATKTQPQRDMVAHGVWGKHENKWHVLRLAAQRATPELRPELKRLSRAVMPQRELITVEKLRAIEKQIVLDAKAIETMRATLSGALSPSRYRPLPYSRRRGSRKQLEA